MRRLVVFSMIGFGSLISAAAAQVSTDDGGGISSLHRRDDIPPGRQATEAPRGDGVDIDELEPIADESSGAQAGDDEQGDFNTEPRRSVRADRRRAPALGDAQRQGGIETAEPALGTPPLRSRRVNRIGSADGPRGGRPQNRWRYQRYNGYWWYWTPNNRWAFYNGQRWIDYNSELANQWARGVAVGNSEMGLGGGGDGSGDSYGVSGMNGMLGRAGQNSRSRGGVGGLGTNAGGLGSAQIPGPGTAPGRSAIPRFRGGGGSMAAGGLGTTGAGGSLGGGAGGSVGGAAGGVTGEGLGSSLFGNSGGMAAVPGISGTRGSLGGASGVGITAGGRSGDANSGVGGGTVGGAGIGGTGGMGGVGPGN